MSQILLAWELGLGTGHLHKLSSVIAPIQEMGHKIAVAAKDTIVAQQILGTGSIVHLAAPYWSGYDKGLSPADNYNEVLFHVGYLEQSRVDSLLNAWINIINLTKAELVIAEHSPTALIAAHICQVPTIVVGTGFTVPPKISPLPTLKPWLNLNVERSLKAERKSLQIINESIEGSGGHVISEVASLFHKQDPVLLTLPELDHYGVRKGARYWGAHISQSQVRPEPVWPTQKGEKVFIYLHHNLPHFRPLIKQLRDSNYSTLVISPGIPEGYGRMLSCNNIRVSGQQVDIQAVSKQCRIIFNHAAHGTMAHFFYHGKPMILLPNFVEQSVIAHRADEQLLSLVAYGKPDHHDYISMIDELMDSSVYFDAAKKISSYYKENPFNYNDLSMHIKCLVNDVL